MIKCLLFKLTSIFINGAYNAKAFGKVKGSRGKISEPQITQIEMISYDYALT
jgi:hypothetical protein